MISIILQLLRQPFRLGENKRKKLRKTYQTTGQKDKLAGNPAERKNINEQLSKDESMVNERLRVISLLT